MKKLEQEVFDLLEKNDFIEDVKEFLIIDEGDWRDEGKYSYLETIIKYKELFFQINVSRTGSYYTDYDYSEPEVMQVEPKEEIKIITNWVKVE